MTTISKKITSLLSQAVEKHDLALLKEAFASLRNLEDGVAVDQATAFNWSADLYLFCCETALSFEQWEMAQHCQDRLLENTTTAKSYQIRTLYCRAQLDAHYAFGQRCSELVDSITVAMGKVLKGVRLALQDPNRHSHLVVSGTQYLWNVSNVLYRDGTYAELVTPYTIVVQALEKVEYSDWLCRNAWLLRNATALAGCGRHSEANAVLTKASESVAKYTPQYKLPVYRMQVALSKAIANPKVRADGAKGVMRAVFAAQSLFCGLLEGPAVETELLAAYQEITAEMKQYEQEIAGGVAAAKEGGKGAKTPAPPAKGKEGKGGKEDAAAAAQNLMVQGKEVDENQLRDETYAEVGLALALIQQTEKAHEVVQKSMQSKRLRSRIFAEYAQAMLRAIDCGGMKVQNEVHAGFLTNHMIQELGNAVRHLERALESAIRLTDPLDQHHVLQFGAVLMWNIGLPLLQPEHRHIISKPFQTAIKLLEEIGSNMNTLRVLFLHETALCDSDSDYLNKAIARVAKGLGVDYSVDPETQKLYSLERPLDRFLVWAKRRMIIKSNLYDHPDNPEDEALLILEQARDASLMSKLSTLNRAMSILKNSEPPEDYLVEEKPHYAELTGKDAKKGAAPPPAAAKGKGKGKGDEAEEAAPTFDPDTERKHCHLRDRANLWHMLQTIAWKERSPTQLEVTRTAAEHLIKRNWYRRGDRDMNLLVADAYFTLADCEVAELESQGLRLTQRTFVDEKAAEEDEDLLSDQDDVDLDPEEKEENKEEDLALQKWIAERSALVKKSQAVVAENLVKAGELGCELVLNQNWEDHWIVMNAATALWNYYTESFSTNDFCSAMPALEQLIPLLMSIGLDPKKETGLLKDLGFAYVRGCVQYYVRDKLQLDDSSAAIDRVAEIDVYTFHHVDTGATNQKLIKANETCEKMIALLPTAMDGMSFVMAGANIRRLQGKPVEARSIPQQKVMTVLDQLAHPHISMDDKRNLLNGSYESLSVDPNIELCARMAEKCLAVSQCERLAIKVCKIGQGLYNDGLLGLKQAEVQQVAAPVKGAKGGDAKAAKGAPPPETDAAEKSLPPPEPSQEDWLWYALMLQYQGLAISLLVNPSVQDKSTQFEIRRQALVSLANSASAALMATPEFKQATLMKALRHYRYMSQEFAADATTRQFAYPSLRVLMNDKILTACPSGNHRPSADKESDADVIAALFLLLLRCFRDNGAINEGLVAMKTAIKRLPATHHKPFWDLDIQLRCQSGMPTNQTLLRVKEYSAETQARVWNTLANYSRDPRDQLFAYQSAIDVLAKTPTQQALYIVAMAQWMLRSNFDISLASLKTFITSAIDLVADSIDAEGDDDLGMSEMGSVAGRSFAGKSGRGQSLRKSSVSDSVRRGTTTFAPSGERSVRSAKSKRAPAKANVSQLATVVQAYYLLSKLGGGLNSSEQKNCLMMIVHYVTRLWGNTVSIANTMMARSRARQEKNEAKAAQLTAPTSEPAGKAGAAAGKGGRRGSAAGKGPSVSVKAPEPVAAPEKSANKIDASTFEPVVLPSMPQGWIGFSVHAAFTQTLRGVRNIYALTPGSLDTPDALLSVLGSVAEDLVSEKLELYAHPVLSLMDLMTQVFFPNGAIQNAAKTAVSLHTANTLDLCGAGFAASLFRVPQPHPSVTERTALAEDARMIASSRQEQEAATAKDRAHKTAAEGSVKVTPSDSRPIYLYWASSCQQLLTMGRIAAARDLLADTEVHALAHGDSATMAKVKYFQARIEFLEGHVEVSKQRLQEAFEQSPTSGAAAAHSLDVSLWLDMKLLEGQLLLLGHNIIDEIFAMEKHVLALLQQQLDTCPSGIQLEIARSAIPQLQCNFSIQLVKMLLSSFKAKQGTELGKFPNSLLLKGLVSMMNALSFRVEKIPALHSDVMLLEIELGEFERYVTRHQGVLARYKLLNREATSLETIAAKAKAQMSNSLGGSDGVHVNIQGQNARLVARALCCLAENTMERAKLNGKLLDEYRRSNVTEVDYPKIEGAPPDHEKEIVRFMRSTKNQRAAGDRRKQRDVIRKEVEEKRETARFAKQEAIEARREAKRVEEASAAPGKGPKGRAAAKGGQQEQEPDVDPNDKCDIDSPPDSDDDGMGEDSASEEENELVMAVKDVFGGNATAAGGHDPVVEGGGGNGDSAALPAPPTFMDALELFRTAEDIFGSEGPEYTRIQAGLGVAMQSLNEAALIHNEQRGAMFKGEEAPPACISSHLHKLWNHPISVIPPDTEDILKAKPGAKGAAAKPSAPPGKAGAASPGANANQPMSPEVEKKVPEILPVSSLRSKPQYGAEAATMLERAIVAAHANDDYTTLNRSLIAYADQAVGKKHFQTAGKAVAALQASKMKQFLLSLWEMSSFPDLDEIVLYRAIKSLKSQRPDLVGTPHYAGMVKALYGSQSKMLHRVSIPVHQVQFGTSAASTDATNAPTSPTGTSPVPGDDPLHALPNDLITMTIVLGEERGSCYASVQRTNGAYHTQRVVNLDLFKLEAVSAAMDQINQRRGAALSSDSGKVNATQLQMIDSDFEANVLIPLSELLDELLSPFAPLLEHLAKHMVLLLDPQFAGLPLESLPVLKGCKSISRELNLFTLHSKIQRRATERFQSQGSLTVVDTHNDTPGAAKSLLGPDYEKQATGGGGKGGSVATNTTLTPTMDENKYLRPLSVAQLQRGLSSTHHTIVTMLTNGALGNAIPLPNLSGLTLEHVRVMVCCDRGTNSTSTRRENKSNMSKLPETLWTELPHNVALLLLARGVDSLVYTTTPNAPSFNEILAKIVLSQVEKGTPKNLGETLRTQLANDSLSVNIEAHMAASSHRKKGDPAVPTPEPASPRENTRLVERHGVVAYGIPLDDSSAPAKGGK